MKNLVFTLVFLCFGTFSITTNAQEFIERTGNDFPFITAKNPLSGENGGFNAAPSVADLDQDGDWDVLVGNGAGELQYFKNTGYADQPLFEEQTGGANPFDGLSVGTYTYPAFADLNGDQLPDLLVGNEDGQFHYFLNTGSSGAPAFTEQTGSNNPMDGVDIGTNAAPHFADIDDDGDLDLFIGNDTGIFDFYENTGSNTSPVFQQMSGADNPLDGVDVGTYSTVAFLDLDEDGDLDAYMGSSTDNGEVYLNAGTVTAPQFSVANAPSVEDIDRFRHTPTVADLNADMKMDIIFGTSTGTLELLEIAGDGRLLVSETDPTHIISSGFRSTVVRFVDIDDDGDEDAFVGQGPGTVKHYENTGTPTAPTFTEQMGSDNPLDGVDVGLSSFPVFVDIDGDGDQDAFIWGTNDKYLKNEGTASAPNFVEQTNTSFAFQTSWGGTFADFDDDGDFDCMVSGDDEVQYFKNIGTATSPDFAEQFGADNPFDDLSLYDITESFVTPNLPAAVDADEDGDVDVVFGTKNGLAYYVENSGTPSAPVFVYSTANNLTINASVNDAAAPAFCDLDGDGNVNMALAGDWGVINYYEIQYVFDFNTSWFEFPASNSMTGGEFAPTMVDIDGDGDLDVFVGVESQQVFYFENVGTTALPALRPPVSGVNPLSSANGAIDYAVTPAFHFNESNQVWDAYFGGGFGETRRWRNNGTATQPNLSSTSLNGLNAADVSCEDQTGCYTMPGFGDVNGDGNVDAIVLNTPAANGFGDFEISFLDCTGCNSPNPNFTKRTGIDNPFDDITAVQLGSLPAPALGDMDNDGDEDLVVGNSAGDVHYFKNIGTPTAPDYEKQTGMDNPFDGEDYGAIVKPAFGDMDGDGDLDILIGNDGSGEDLIYLENQLIPASPSPCSFLTNPQQGTVEVDPTAALSWNPILHATGYELTVGTSSGGTDILDHFDVGNITTYNPTGDFPQDSTIYVTIHPYNIDGTATGCLEEHFFVETTAPICATMVDPLNGATDVSVNAGLHWKPTVGGGMPSGYRVTIGTSSGGTDILDDFDVGDMMDFHPGTYPAFTTIYATIIPYNPKGEPTSCTEISFTTGEPPCSPVFTETSITGLVNGAEDVKVADFNGDGHLDLLTVGAVVDDIFWFENDGSQNYTQHTVDASSSGRNLDVVDMDGDGDIDILALNTNQNDVVWYENDGTGTFTKFIIDFNLRLASDVLAHDFNGDGHMDLAAVGSLDNEVVWYQNDGAQEFEIKTIDDGFDSYSHLDIGDVDGDGDADVVVASETEDDLVWYENDGFSVNFTKHILDENFDDVREVYAVDMDLDADIDILACAEEADEIAWWENDGNEQFTKRIAASNLDGVRRIFPADVNGDGDMDIVATAFEADQVLYFDNDGSQNFTKDTLLDNYNGANGIIAADLDADGDLDVLAAAYNDDKLTFWENSCDTSLDCTFLTDPANGAMNVPVSTNLTWGNIPDATGYKLNIGTTAGGTDILDDEDVGNVNTYDPANDLPASTTIYVTVIAYNANEEAMGCLEKSFTTDNGNSPPDCTALTDPLNGATDVDVATNLTWTGVPAATGYKLTIGTTSGGTDILNNVDLGNVTTYDPTSDLPYSTIIYVKIIPYNGNGDAVNCSEENFTTIGQVPDCTTLTDPLDGATDVDVSTDLTWSSSANATGYKLTVGTTSGGTDILNNFDVGNTTTYDLPNDLPASTTIYVTIVPYNSSGDAIGCMEESFTTSSPPLPDCTSLTNPLDGATDVDVSTDLTWSSSANATGYKLTVGTTSGGTDILNNFDVGNTTTYDLPNDLPASTTIYVTIVPYNSSGDAMGCTEESFTTGSGTAPNCTALTKPLDGDIDVSIATNLDWASAPTATGYKLTVGTTSGGTDILDDFDVGNVTTYDPVNDFPPFSMIYVTIVPYNSSGDATGCLEESFETGDLPMPPFCTILMSPIGGATNVDVATDIEWLFVPDVIGYRLTIGTTSGGTDILDDFDVGNTTIYNPPANLPGTTTIYITIIPYNAFGDAMGCLEESFTTGAPSGAPPLCTGLVSPLPGTTGLLVETEVKWGSIPDADGYRVDMGTSFGATNILDDFDFGADTTYFPPPPLFLPYDSTVYITITPYNVYGDATNCKEEILSFDDCTLPNFYGWTGSTGTWTTWGNWTGAYVPYPCVDVQILSGNVILQSGKDGKGATLEVGIGAELTVEQGAVLTIEN